MLTWFVCAKYDDSHVQAATCHVSPTWYLCAQCEVSSLCQASFIQLITTMDSLVRIYQCSPSVTSMNINDHKSAHFVSVSKDP